MRFTSRTNSKRTERVLQSKFKRNTIKSGTTTNLPFHEPANCVNKPRGNSEELTEYSTKDMRILRISSDYATQKVDSRDPEKEKLLS